MKNIKAEDDEEPIEEEEEDSEPVVDVETVRWPFMDLLAPMRIGDTASTQQENNMKIEGYRILAAQQFALLATMVSNIETKADSFKFLKKSSEKTMQKSGDGALNQITDKRQELANSVEWLNKYYKGIKPLLEKMVKTMNKRNFKMDKDDAAQLNFILQDLVRVMEHVDEAANIIDGPDGLEDNLHKIGV